MAKTKVSRMTVTIWSLVGILVIAALTSVSLIRGQEACAEGRKVSGVTESVEPLAQDHMVFPNELIFIHFRIQLWVLRSADPDWDKAGAFHQIRSSHQGDVVQGVQRYYPPRRGPNIYEIRGKGGIARSKGDL